MRDGILNGWASKNEVDKRIEFPGGGSVTVVTTADPDNIRSEGYDGMVVDEAAHMDDGVWAYVLRPMLVDKQGWAMFCTTPNGHNWFKKTVWNRAEGRKGWSRWRLPTSDNPNIPQAELDEALIDMGPHTFAQEHLAEFVSIAGAEFPATYFEHLWDSEIWPDTFDIGAIAVDPSKGRETGDYSAIVFCGLSGGLLWVDADIQRRPVPQIVQDGVAMAGRYCPAAFGIEGNAFQDLLAPEFDRCCQGRRIPPLPIHLIDNRIPKLTRIRRLSPYLANGKFRFRHGSKGCQLLEEQLRGFPLPSVHDDGPDALEMAVRLMEWLTAGVEEPQEEMLIG